MKQYLLFATMMLMVLTSCAGAGDKTNSTNENSIPQQSEKAAVEFPDVITINGVAQNPEGIEYNKNDKTFFLSSLNAGPIIKVELDGSFKPFTSGEAYPMSTAGLQIDYKNNRLLAAAFNGLELMDEDPATKGISNLRIYNLETGVLEKDINLSSLFPDGNMFFANDIAVDNEGNIYVTDWYAAIIYKIDLDGNPSVFWKNETGIASGPNGLDFHPDGYLLVSILTVNEKGLYDNFGLVKIPVNDPESAKVVDFPTVGYTGFDGMVITEKGNVIGVTNNGTSPGGNTLIELTSTDNWKSAKVIQSKSITASTTVAITPESINYLINQDFTSNDAETWTIERVEF